MGVYVDRARWPFRNMVMCHMVADTIEELTDMASKLGLRRSWIQRPKHSPPHYDLSKSMRAKAIKLGAVAVSDDEMVKLIKKHRREQNGK